MKTTRLRLQLFLISLVILFGTLRTHGQTVTYNILSTGLVNMRAINGTEDYCFVADYKQITPGSVWGIDWTSIQANIASSVTVEMMYTFEEGNGPYDVTLNGVSEISFNPPAINCGYSVQSYTFSPTSYNSGGLNQLRFDYTSGGATHFMNYNFGWGGLYYARIIVTYDMPLPIELLNFNSKLINGNRVQLNWQTTSETNNEYFIIERSNDGSKWKEFKRIEGAGNSSQLLTYIEIDNNPFSGVSYYRLMQTDFDGTFEYSKVVSVNLSYVEKIKLYPNPTGGRINVLGLENGKVRIMSSFGNLVKAITFHQSEIDISELPSGVYFIQIISDDHEVFTQRIFKE